MGPNADLMRRVFDDVVKAWGGAGLRPLLNPERAERVLTVWQSKDAQEVGDLISEVTGAPFVAVHGEKPTSGKLAELSASWIKIFAGEIHPTGVSPMAFFDEMTVWVENGRVSHPYSQLAQLTGFISSQYESEDQAQAARMALASPHVPAVACIHCCIADARGQATVDSSGATSPVKSI